MRQYAIQMIGMEKLDSRARQILNHIIEHFITTAEPVGSRALSKLVDFKISAATIRNIMSDLTDLGLISQPHISAGRIPTDLGYRYYINNILNTDDKREMAPEVQEILLTDNNIQRLEDILLEVSDELSRATNCTSIIISPQPAASKLRNIEFIRLNDRQLLCVLITQIGMVRNRIITLKECPDQAKLDDLGALICVLFKDQTLTKIKATLVEIIKERMEGSNTESLVLAIKLGKKAFELELNDEIFILGRSRMCSFPEFSNQETLKLVFKALDDKKALFKTLVEVMDGDGIQIRVGTENVYDGLAECSVVAGAYGTREYLLGSLGIVGPKRIDYPRIISEIDQSSQKLSYAITKFLEHQ